MEHILEFSSVWMVGSIEIWAEQAEYWLGHCLIAWEDDLQSMHNILRPETDLWQHQGWNLSFVYKCIYGSASLGPPPTHGILPPLWWKF